MHVEAVMGTAVTIDIRDSRITKSVLDRALCAAVRVLYEADRTFSTYDPGSCVSLLRRGEVTAEQCPEVVSRVLDLCATAWKHSDGWFDPWAMPGGLDPTGLVKGWAGHRALRTLVDHGVRHAVVNAGGDLVVTGNASGRVDGSGWRIGVIDPQNPGRVLETISATDVGVATSGAYERGPLGFDPHAQRPAQRLASATVIALDLALADAYATAAVAQGPAALGWLAPLPGVRAVLVTHDGTVFRTRPVEGQSGRPGPPLRVSPAVVRSR
jgi:thiamine biosynthesis lipoprotein